jgi:hypothetical protein
MQGQSSGSLWGNKNKQGFSFGKYNLQGAWTREINGAEFLHLHLEASTVTKSGGDRSWVSWWLELIVRQGEKWCDSPMVEIPEWLEGGVPIHPCRNFFGDIFISRCDEDWEGRQVAGLVDPIGGFKPITDTKSMERYIKPPSSSGEYCENMSGAASHI